MASAVRPLTFLVLALAAALPSPTWAGEPGDHRRSFFIRSTFGVGYAKTENEEGSPSSIGSGAFAYDIAVGATVMDNLAIHGSWFAWFTFPNYEITVLGTSVPTDVTMQAFGGGLTYYFMPVNIYLSANAGAGHLIADIDSDWGLALNFVVGKEWWRSKRRWGMENGLGIAAAAGYHNIHDPKVDYPFTPEVHDRWNGYNLVLLATATLN